MRVEHLSVPFNINRRGHAETVEQDTSTEIAQSVAVLIATHPGERRAVPSYGIEDLAFQDAAYVTEDTWLMEAVERWEPRADVSLVSQEISRSGRIDIEIRAG